MSRYYTMDENGNMIRTDNSLVVEDWAKDGLMIVDTVENKLQQGQHVREIVEITEVPPQSDVTIEEI